MAKINGKKRIFFGGPIGFAYAFEPLAVPAPAEVQTLKKVWEFNCDLDAPTARAVELLQNQLDRFDKYRAFRAQLADDVFVVHDLVTDIDRTSKAFERPFNDLDRAVDSRAETPRLGQHHVHRQLPYSTPRISTSKSSAWPASGWLKSNSTDCSVISLTTPAYRPPPGDGAGIPRPLHGPSASGCS